MTEPRIDWGLAVAARVTRVRSATRPRPNSRLKGASERPSDKQVVDAMVRGEFASEFAGRRMLLSMIGRLVGLAVVAMVIAIVAGVIGERTAGSVLEIVKAVSGAGAVFVGALAVIVDRRWRRLAASGIYPRRRSTLVLPLTPGVLTAVSFVAAHSAR